METSNWCWDFDHEKFSTYIGHVCAEYGEELVCLVMDVHPTTVKYWSEGKWKDGFTWPAMHNFVKLAQEFDVDPREFFCIRKG